MKAKIKSGVLVSYVPCTDDESYVEVESIDYTTFQDGYEAKVVDGVLVWEEIEED